MTPGQGHLVSAEKTADGHTVDAQVFAAAVIGLDENAQGIGLFVNLYQAGSGANPALEIVTKSSLC